MKHKWKLASTIGVLGVVGATTYAIGNKVYRGTIKGKPHVLATEMETFYKDPERDVYTQLQTYEQTKEMVTGKNGYDIECLRLKSPVDSNRVMILVHGFTSNYYDIIKTAFMYLDNGYHVVLYHQRQTGFTGGDDYTFGHYEQHDLDAIVSYTRGLYPNCLLGVHGFSMGAATSALHTKLNEDHLHVNFYVLDAPYHTMTSAIELGIISENIPIVPVKYTLWAGNMVTKIKTGFRYRDIEPIQAIKQTSVPVMFIHGDKDQVTSPEGSKLMYDAIPHKKKQLWLVKDYGHCVVSNEDPDQYWQNISKFLETYVIE